jgi:protoporphyrinogen oxidase
VVRPRRVQARGRFGSKPWDSLRSFVRSGGSRYVVRNDERQGRSPPLPFDDPMIAIIGAGPAALVAAWRAASAGHEVVVFERGATFGGMAGSFEVAGMRVDHGSHRLHPSTPPAILGALHDLLGSDLQLRRRNGRLRLFDRWVAFPLRTDDLWRNTPRRFTLRAGWDAATAPLRRPRADTFAEVVRAGLGRAVLDGFYGPYARKVWDAHPEDLAGELAYRRVSAASPLAILRRLRRGDDHPSRMFLYPRTGYGAIAEAMAEAAVAAGASLCLSCGVTRLRPLGGPGGNGARGHAGQGGWTLDLADGTSLDVDQVWSTIPLPLLAGMVAPAPPDHVRYSAERLRHRATVLLYLVLEQPQWTPFDAHYFPGAETIASRVSEPRNYRDNPDDPAHHTVLCAEVPCWAGDAIWHATDADLAARLVDELERAGLPPVEVSHAESRRLPRVHPVYRPGFTEDVAELEAWADALPGLATFGRQGLFTPDNTHHTLAMGWAAADTLASSNGASGTAAWAAARETFRSFVVED